MLVICRIGQGLFGGPIMPLSQTLLMRIFPPEKHSQAMGMWAMTTVVGPILGPIFKVVRSVDNWSWHWIFFINIPVGVICAVGVMRLLKVAETPIAKLPIDTIGLTLLIVWIGALQLMLDLGHERDWFNNSFICILAVILVVGFIAFFIWEYYEKTSHRQYTNFPIPWLYHRHQSHWLLPLRHFLAVLYLFHNGYRLTWAIPHLGQVI